MPQTPAPLDKSASQQAKRARSHSRVVRLSAYPVASVLALLMTTATLPPLLADQSDRAVIPDQPADGAHRR